MQHFQFYKRLLTLCLLLGMTVLLGGQPAMVVAQSNCLPLCIANGNVGIGTLTPALPLHVVAASNAVAVLESTSPNSVLRLLNSGGENNFVQLGNLSGRFGVRVAGGGEVFNILPNGFVGINTLEPNATLDVAGNIAIANTFPSGSPGLPTLNVSQEASGHIARFVSKGTSAGLFLQNQGGESHRVELFNQPEGRFAVIVGGGNEALSVTRNGFVGINRLVPDATLDVAGNMIIANTFPSGSPALPTLNVSQEAGGLVGRFVSKGTSAGLLLHARGAASEGVVLTNQPDGGFSVLIAGGTPAFNITGGGLVGINTTEPHAELEVNGTTSTRVLQITGGDLAEPFEIAEADTIQPGMVVAIDPDNPGQMRLANTTYDRTVAGVISGAGGIELGVLMYKDGAGEDTHPVALTGRVYVFADVSNGAIVPGDLLTTSATPGHAMKVTDYERAQGAILGKAMSKLEKGTGLVLMLVTLQ